MTELDASTPDASTGLGATDPGPGAGESTPSRAVAPASTGPEIVVQSTLPPAGAPPVVRVSLEVPVGVAISIHVEAHSTSEPAVVRTETLVIGRAEPPLRLQPAAEPSVDHAVTVEPTPVVEASGSAPTPVRAASSSVAPTGPTLAPEATAVEPPPPPLETSAVVRTARRAWTQFRADALPSTRLNLILLGAMLGLYALTRLVSLDQFPIYFFSDEASIALLGRTVVQNGFADSAGNLLPVYFEAAPQRFTPVVTAYALGLATSWFGNSIEVVRGTSALISILGVAAVALAAHRVFKARFWWVTILIFTLSPIWLIHSRTAFEATSTASFYAGFLLFYLLYRERSPYYGFPALLCGALTFYSYSNAQAVMAVTGVLLLASDLKYHWRLNRKVQIALIIWGLAMAWPLISFQLGHEDALGTHLRAVNSYLFSQDLSWGQKLWMYVQRYAYGLSPQYWFLPNTTDLPRHRIPGQSQLLGWAFPFVLLGVWVVLRHVKSPTHRAVALAALAAPAGAATLEIGAARVMTFVPAAILLAALGIDWLIARLPRLQVPRIESLFAALLGLGSLALTALTFQAAPLWFTDYGLYGMQYGAKQIFVDVIPALLKANPDNIVMVSSTWANGTDRYREFFLSGNTYDHVAIRGIDWYQSHYESLTPNLVFVGTPAELKSAQDSGKFEAITPEQTLSYPDGSPGFYIFRAAYTPEAKALFDAEAEARKRPVVDEVELDGQTVAFTHSLFDMGTVAHLLDNDPFTLARGMEANPLLLQVDFATPRNITAVNLTTGTMDLFTVTVNAYTDVDGQPITVSREFANAGPDPSLRVELPKIDGPIARLSILIHDELSGDHANIHVREFSLEP